MIHIFLYLKIKYDNFRTHYIIRSINNHFLFEAGGLSNVEYDTFFGHVIHP